MMISTNYPKPSESSAQTGRLCVLEPPRRLNLPVALLAPGKYLVGSSESCTIHLVVEGVQPRHAMIFVGDQKTVLKALDPRTWVNDSAVSETALRPRDRVTIGPITYLVRYATEDELRVLAQPVAQATTSLEAIRISVAPTTTSPVLDAPAVSALEEERQGERIVVSEALIPPAEDNSKTITPSLRFDNSVNELPIAPSPDFAEVQQAPEANAQYEAHRSEVTLLSAPSALDAIPELVAAIGLPPLVKIPDFVERVPPPIPDTMQPVEEPGSFEQPTTPVRERYEEGNESLDDTVETLQVAQIDQHQKLVAEFAQQSGELQSKLTQLSQREAEFDEKQASITAENDRNAGEIQRARRELEEEHARHSSLWNQWDESYRRSTNELNAQLEDFERRRIEIQNEEERLGRERIELQRSQSEFEGERSSLATERQRVESESISLQEKSAALETKRKQELATLKQRSAQLDSDREALKAAKNETQALRRQLEQERALLATDRSSDALRREQENREISAARMRINEEELALQKIRADLESRESQILREQQELILFREELTAAEESLRNDCAEFDQRQRSYLASSNGDHVPVTAAGPVAEYPRPDVAPVSEASISAVAFNSERDGSPSAIREISSGPHNEFAPSLQIESGAIEMRERNFHSDLRASSTIESRLGEVVSVAPIRHQLADVTCTADTKERDSVELTLSEVNRQFGSPVTAESTSEIPISELADAVEDVPSAADKKDSLASLRAQLAQMFELSQAQGSQQETANNASEGLDAAESQTDASHSALAAESTTNRLSDADFAPVNQQTSSEVLSEDSVVANDSAAAASQEDPWTRRLRELSMVASGNPVPPPVPSPAIDAAKAAEAVDDESSGDTDNHTDDDEYSVEAQLARLLGKPAASKPARESARPVAPSVVDGNIAVADRPPLVVPDEQDRSHLKEEPRHRQDKTAVRDAVQSFREVAQMSARSALAKHSWTNLKNKVFFKVVMAAVSVAAVVWFGGNHLLGSKSSLLVIFSCIAVMLVTFYNLFQTSSELKKLKPGSTDRASENKTLAADPDATPTDAD